MKTNLKSKVVQLAWQAFILALPLLVTLLSSAIAAFVRCHK
jgi:hypothetical protein